MNQETDKHTDKLASEYKEIHKSIDKSTDFRKVNSFSNKNELPQAPLTAQNPEKNPSPDPPL